jgi:hypothetical protein
MEVEMKRLLTGSAVVVCLILGSGAWSRAEEQEAKPRWEYQFVTAVEYADDWHPRFANGAEVENWKTVTLYQYANALGDAGWEMVNLSVVTGIKSIGVVGGSSVGYRMVFKRRK